MKLGTQAKQPRERISVLVRYGEALDSGDTVARVFPNCEVRQDPPRSDNYAALAAVPLFVDAETVRIWLQGGDDGTRYKVTVRVRTARGELLEDELKVKIKEL
jgi:hypothetical protein